MIGFVCFITFVTLHLQNCVGNLFRILMTRTKEFFFLDMTPCNLQVGSMFSEEQNTLNMETAGSSETLFPVCQAVRRRISEEFFLDNHRFWNHKFDKYEGRHAQKSKMRCRNKNRTKYCHCLCYLSFINYSTCRHYLA